MKRLPTRNASKDAGAARQSDAGEARMAAYLERTRPAFAQQLVKSLTLGAAANGVLAGPVAGPEPVKPLRRRAS